METFQDQINVAMVTLRESPVESVFAGIERQVEFYRGLLDLDAEHSDDLMGDQHSGMFALLEATDKWLLHQAERLDLLKGVEHRDGRLVRPGSKAPRGRDTIEVIEWGLMAARTGELAKLIPNPLPI